MYYTTHIVGVPPIFLQHFWPTDIYFRLTIEETTATSHVNTALKDACSEICHVKEFSPKPIFQTGRSSVNGLVRHVLIKMVSVV